MHLDEQQRDRVVGCECPPPASPDSDSTAITPVTMTAASRVREATNPSAPISPARRISGNSTTAVPMQLSASSTSSTDDHADAAGSTSAAPRAAAR